MKVIALNGSPRINWNTEQLLRKALDGAVSVGAETELIQLYGEPFKGCVSCFACKIKNSKTNGFCAYRDALTPILHKVRKADVIIVGSPVYFDYPTAQTRAFLERLMFPIDPYMVDPETHQRVRYLNKTIPTAMIYTMNCPERLLEKINYPTILGANQSALKRLFGYCETLYSCDTCQFSDYSKYDVNMFSAEMKEKHKVEQFPDDLKKAFDIGKRLSEMVLQNIEQKS